MNHTKGFSKELQHLKTIKAKHRIHKKIPSAYSNLKLNRAELTFKHLRNLKRANRLSASPLIQTYSVAEHCYYTGLLFLLVADKEVISVTPNETLWVFQHDVLESVTGDLLLPVKTYSPITRKCWKEIEHELIKGDYSYLSHLTDNEGRQFFTPDAWELFKIVDLLELWLFCKEEIMLGNGYKVIKTIIKNCEDLIFPYRLRYVNDILGGLIEDLWK